MTKRMDPTLMWAKALKLENEYERVMQDGTEEQRKNAWKLKSQFTAIRNLLKKREGEASVEKPLSKWDKIISEHRAEPQPKKGTKEYYAWLRKKNEYLQALKMKKTSTDNWYTRVLKREKEEKIAEAVRDAGRIKFYDLMDPHTVYDSVQDAVRRNACSRTAIVTRLRKGRYVRIGLEEDVPAYVIDAYFDGRIMNELHQGGDVFLKPTALFEMSEEEELATLEKLREHQRSAS